MLLFVPESYPAHFRGDVASSKNAVSIVAVIALVLMPGCRHKDTSNAVPDKATDAHAHGDSHEGHARGEEQHSGEVKLTSDAIARYGIRIESASLWKLQPAFMAPARVAFNAETMAHVGSPLPGRVVELPVRLGDKVQIGDVLLQVESPQLGEAQSEFLQKRILAQSAIPAVELARNALDRATRLYDQNRGIALDEVQKREAEFRVAFAAQKSAESAVIAAENKLHLLGMDQAAVERLVESGEVQSRFPIRAPVPGTVVEREVTLGELVSPEKEALLVLADTETVWVLADVPEARLPNVVVGAAAWLKTSGLETHKHEGSVSYIAPMVDARTRTAQVRIDAKCEHGSLWPGMFVQAEITATDRNNPDPAPVIAVPEEAVQTMDRRSVIFVPVPNEENTFVQRAVSVDKSVSGLVPIHSGLVEGEPYVAAGSFILKAELGKGSAAHEH
ncbi:MAG: efflux RND transporter periplasmic adaptor subunit [Phycisphaerales bacterium]|nr:efflux RND transporter periplasmic adaptor subunit [Phycisphaerales bacterium]